MDVTLGAFAVPDARDPARTVETIVAADRAGLDVVGVQDHPYQRRFLDTWTLLAYVAARTERIRLVPDVVNLPLRPPSVLAKAAAPLDVLSARIANVMALDGRVDDWPDRLARIASDLRFDALLVAVPDEDPVGFVRRLGEDVAPRVRDRLA